MNKYRKLTIIFILLSSISLAGGLALQKYVENAAIIGLGIGFLFQIMAFRYTIKAQKEQRNYLK